jgi:hypothetical protein
MTSFLGSVNPPESDRLSERQIKKINKKISSYLLRNSNFDWGLALPIVTISIYILESRINRITPFAKKDGSYPETSFNKQKNLSRTEVDLQNLININRSKYIKQM